jgi:hypothetical protein
MLKLKLGAFGWAEAVRRERRAARSVASGGGAAGAGGAGGGGGGGGEMAAELSDYLGRMGGACNRAAVVEVGSGV